MDVKLRNKARKYLERMSEPLEGDIRPIIGQNGFLRAKIGGYRILFKIMENYIFVTNIVPRGQAYNKKEKQK